MTASPPDVRTHQHLGSSAGPTVDADRQPPRHRPAPADHDHDHDHDHDAFDDEPWLPSTESVTLTSVGIDVGSATSHVTFSRLTLERQGRQLSSRYAVVERAVLSHSDVWLTPYSDERTIDAVGLAARVAEAYEAAGLAADAVDTGAVIVTGEAARKVNAERIVAALASHAGGFVCATAGPRLEGVLAAHGSGALQRSRSDGPVLNVDIGGGTTKLVLVSAGDVERVHAVNVGGRLIAWDADRRVVRIEEAGRTLARAAGVSIQLGALVSTSEVTAIARVGAEVLIEAMAGAEPSSVAEQLTLTPRLAPHSCRTVMFSGGVGSLVGEPPGRSYDDLGDVLARELESRLRGSDWMTVRAQETLRATVVGVGQFTVQLSGNTISVSRPDLLPVHNVPVVALQPRVDGDRDEIVEALRAALRAADLEDGHGPLAVSLRLRPPESPRDIMRVAEALTVALPLTIAGARPLVIVVDQDVAGLLGHLMAGEATFGGLLVVLDQVAVEALDFLDVGRVHSGSGVVPVVVKSLIF